MTKQPVNLGAVTTVYEQWNTAMICESVGAEKIESLKDSNIIRSIAVVEFGVKQ